MASEEFRTLWTDLNRKINHDNQAQEAEDRHNNVSSKDALWQEACDKVMAIFIK